MSYIIKFILLCLLLNVATISSISLSNRKNSFKVVSPRHVENRAKPCSLIIGCNRGLSSLGYVNKQTATINSNDFFKWG